MVLFLDKNKNVCGFINEKYKYIFYLDIDENDLETIDYETDLKPHELINKKYENGKLVELTSEEKSKYYPEQSNISDIELLKGQIQAISGRNDFIENCITEMAMEVYK